MPTQNYDNLLVGSYIRAIENPDSVGFKNGRWYAPDLKSYDPNNRGFGVDVWFNNKAAALTKNRKDRALLKMLGLFFLIFSILPNPPVCL